LYITHDLNAGLEPEGEVKMKKSKLYWLAYMALSDRTKKLLADPNFDKAKWQESRDAENQMYGLFKLAAEEEQRAEA
jgi:hypothetical protein